MNPNLKKLLSVIATTFAGAFVAFLAQGGTPTTGEQVKAVLAGAAIAGCAAVIHLFQRPPGSATPDALLADLIARVEPLIARRIVNHPELISVLSRFEAAAASAPELHAQMTAVAFAAHLKALEDNPTVGIMKAQLDKIAATPLDAPVATTTPKETT